MKFPYDNLEQRRRKNRMRHCNYPCPENILVQNEMWYNTICQILQQMNNRSIETLLRLALQITQQQI